MADDPDDKSDPEEDAEQAENYEEVLQGPQYSHPDKSEVHERNVLRRKTGCVVEAIIAFFILGAIVAVVALSDKGQSCNSRPSRDSLQPIACTKSGSVADEPASAATSSSESSSSGVAGGTAGGGTASVAAPDPATLPPGAILFKGESGDNIGFIAQDGASRFLSLTGPGVSKGDAAGTAIATVWDHGTGTVIKFAANLHTSTNNGRYGINVFRNVAATPDGQGNYRHGCAIEIGQTSCFSDAPGGPIVNGDRITIIVGEAGNLNATGDYSADWWFVFQPD